MVMKDIQKVELFQKNYLETMNVIKGEILILIYNVIEKNPIIFNMFVFVYKGDMLKELDDQTRRFTSRLRRQKNDDRLSIRKKILDIFIPKIVGILEEFSM